MHETQPTPEAIQAIRDHLATTHAHSDVDLRRDVAFVGNNRAGARVVYLPEDGLSEARFTCKDAACVGRIYLAGAPSYGHPERNAWLMFAHPELATTLLHGVADPEDRAMLIEDWDRGGMGQRELRAAHTRRAQSTKRTDRPSVEDRRERCQRFLLSQVRTGARVVDATCALDGLRNEDPSAAYQLLMGGPDIRTSETLRKYWSAIPIAVRNAARAAGARARGARRPSG